MTLKTILLAFGLLTPYREDAPGVEKTAQLTAIAASVAAHVRDPELAAFVIAWGDAETHYSLRVHSGACHRWECDHGRARSPWQAHRNGMREERWERMRGIENTDVQVQHAAKMAAWALRECRLTGDERILSAFRVLGGKRCDSQLAGELDRLATFKRVRAKL